MQTKKQTKKLGISLVLLDFGFENQFNKFEDIFCVRFWFSAGDTVGNSTEKSLLPSWSYNPEGWRNSKEINK